MADREWMYSGRISSNVQTTEWTVKTEAFLDQAFKHSKRIKPFCPCNVCMNRQHLGRYLMSRHLMLNGYMPDYKIWVNHGESECARADVMRQRIDGNEDDGVRDMIDDIRDAQMPHSPPSEGDLEELEETAKAFVDMMESAKKPLYKGAKISQSDAILQLMPVKS